MWIHIFIETGLKLVFSLYGLRIRKTRDKKKINNDERNNSEMRNQLRKRNENVWTNNSNPLISKNIFNKDNCLKLKIRMLGHKQSKRNQYLEDIRWERKKNTEQFSSNH